MVEQVAGALLSASLQVLLERLASEEIPQLFQGKKPILDLLDELNTGLLSTNLLLNDAEDKQLANEEVRKWLFKLQDVIYEADDLVDSIDYEALRSKLEGESGSGASKVLMKFMPTFFSPFDNTVKRDATEIQALRSKLEGESGSGASKVLMKFMPTFFSLFDNTVKRDATEILRRLKILLDQKDALGLREGVQNKPSQRPSAPLVEESGVFGRNADKDLIVDMLLSDDASDNKISVIPIVGMGGIGKTTLAQLVYEDDRVKQHFELKAWVTVSDEFDIYRITKTIFEVVTSNKCHIEDQLELQRKLKEALSGKKFLFVHDDVWNENYHSWDVLKSSFESGADGSKIIVTTRSTSVASIMATGKSHYLIDLSHEECWRLFAKHAFGNADSDAHQDLRAIGRKIVNKCKGLPLAIKSLGGLLRSERNPRKWENILNSDVWELYKKEGNILPALWLSYRHLPTHLKRCFAYCSIFPKNYKFERKELIMLWMAEGLLGTDKRRERMEELGEEYFQDLLARSLFQCSSKKESILVMHDLVHDLAIFVSDELCFRLDLSNDLHSLSSKTRHLSYRRGYYDVNELKAMCNAKSLRTFVALPLEDTYYPSMFSNHFVLCEMLLVAGSCLRVLSLSGSSIKELPDSISNLKHLRYLDLSGTKITELPDSICSLYNLQTLLLLSCQNLFQLPKDMGSLVNLRYLDIRGVPLKEMPPKIRNMKSLNIILPDVVLGDGHNGFKMKDFAELEHLQGRLHISGLENIVDAAEASDANLKDKKYLSKLDLSWNADAVVADSLHKENEILDALQPHANLKHLRVESYRGTRISDWIGDHTFSNLVTISIRNCKNCWVLPPLGQLPSLKDLTVYGCGSVISIGDEIQYSVPLFSSLESLSIGNMLMWKEWSFGAGIQEGQIFPLLKTLVLYNCPKLNVGLPCYLPSLEDLIIRNCEKMVVLLPRSSQRTVTTSPSLVSIWISNCPALESLLDWGSHLRLKRQEWSFSEGIQEGQIFPLLKKLQLDRCPKLNVGLPCYLPSLEDLIIRNCEEMVVLLPRNSQRTVTTSPSLVSIWISNCPALESLLDWGSYLRLKRQEWSFSEGIQEGQIFPLLKKLQLDRCPKLNVGLPCYLPSLEDLIIQNCEEMVVLLPRSSQRTVTASPSLVSIWISNCPALESLLDWGSYSRLMRLQLLQTKTLSPNRMHLDLQRLFFLQSLNISYWEDDSFPDEGLLPTTLTELKIQCFSNLETLNGKAFQQLTSLRDLFINRCENLRCLPEEGLPTSLSKLRIVKCPLLKKRCEKDGEDWPKIAHIPSLSVRDDWE